MEIKLHKITVRDLANGYVDNAENGVIAFSGKLDVRPSYQLSLSIRINSATPSSTLLRRASLSM